MTPSEVRPLGIGEILERTATLFVRCYAPLLLVLSIVAIPVAIVDDVAQPATAAFFALVQRIGDVPPDHPEAAVAIVRQLTAPHALAGWAVAVFALGVLVAPLATTAGAVAAAAAYRGATPSVRTAYAIAVRRWIPQLATGAIFVVLFGGALAALAVAALAASTLVLALGAVAKDAATAAGVGLGLALATAYAGAVMLLYLAWQLASVSIALEQPLPVRAARRGLRRTFRRTLLQRSLLVGAGLFTVSLAGTFVLAASGGVLAALTQQNAFGPIVLAVGGIALNGVLTCFVVIYNFDARVRRALANR